MPDLKGSKTEDNLKEAFASESQANRRYLYFAQKADVDGYPEVAALFRSIAEGETGHAFGHFDFLAVVGDPITGTPVGSTEENLRTAIAGETYEYSEMYPGFAAPHGTRASTTWLSGSRPSLVPRRATPPGSTKASIRCADRGPSVSKLTLDDISDVRGVRARARRVPQSRSSS